MASEIRVNQIQSRTGVSTISFTETGPIISGVTTITGDLDVTGLVSYDDVTNIDSVGVVTARDGLHVTGGSLGIGDASPTKPLTVGTTTPVILLDDQSSRTLEIRGPSTTYSATVLTTSVHDLLLGTNNTERLRITSGGNLGIGGLTNPGALLSIPAGESNTPRLAIESAVDDNDFTITQYEDGNGTYTMLGQNVKLNSGGNNTILDSGHRTAGILLDARNHGAITFLTGGTNTVSEPVKITSDGKVGVGVAAPVQMMEIVNTSSTGSQIQFRDTSTAQGNNNGVRFGYNGSGAQIWNFESTYIRFATSNVERLHITSAGDVGIGENSPADRLVVQKTNASGDVGVRIKNDTLTDGSASTPTTASLYLTTSTGDFNSFYVQARRYDNDTHFGYSNPRDGGHTPNMIITNDGQIKTPKQPSFFSRPPGAYNISTGGNTVGGTWQDVHNIGSHFSNGTFTAPVAGTYQFTWSVFSQNETTRLDAYIMVNGTVVMREEINGYPNTSANKNGSVHGCYYLSANDNVTYGIYSAAGNQIYVAAAPWTYASGFLVG